MLQAARREPQGFTHGEQTDGNNNHIDAIEQFRDAKSKTPLPGLQINANQAHENAERQRRNATQNRMTKNG